MVYATEEEDPGRDPYSQKWNVKQGLRTGNLHLSFLNLKAMPPQITSATSPFLHSLHRLDLSYNSLKELPESIGELKALRVLWLHHNPLESLSPALHRCKKLQELDCSHTKITDLPHQLGRLREHRKLVSLNISNCPNLLDVTIRSKASAPYALLTHLLDIDTRVSLREKLTQAVRLGMFTNKAIDEATTKRINAFNEALLDKFQNNSELRNMVRNWERLFPKTIPYESDAEKVATQVYRKFVALKRENRSKALSAEIELKLRGFYYDRLDVTKMEAYLQEIYDYLKRVEDLEFLLKWARNILPSDPNLLTGQLVAENVKKVQTQLLGLRSAAQEKVRSLLFELYADQEPAKVEVIVKSLFGQLGPTAFPNKQEIDDLRGLATDIGSFFPSDFSSIDMESVLSLVRHARVTTAA